MATNDDDLSSHNSKIIDATQLDDNESI